MKRLLLVTAGLLLLATLISAAVLTGRTLTFESRQLPVEPAPALALDANALAQRLAGAIAFPTISHQDPAEFDKAAFAGLHQYLEKQYPLAHATFQREIVNGYSLLYTWEGTDPSAKPALLIAHLDVVPIEPGTESEWEQPPYSGNIEGGFIWGRGTMDDKVSVLGLLEAAEFLIAEGFQPRQTLLFAFGHDEEIGGEQGAQEISALLESRGVEVDFVLDEGMAVVEGLIPGIAGPVGLIGIAEKGYLSVELIAVGEGGHSSQPPAETTLGMLAAAVHRLETRQMPAQIDGPVRAMFDHLGPEMPFATRLVFANTGLFSPVLKSQLAASPSTNAAIRTTTAPTILEGGVKDNVLPSRARAVVNFRILPGDTIESVLEHVRKVINEPRIRVQPLKDGQEPSHVSPLDSSGYTLIHQTIREIMPEAVVAPSLVLGGTDSRHYASLTRNVYRFLPLWLQAEDLARIHGSNERISVENYAQVVAFYVQLMRNTAAPAA